MLCLDSTVASSKDRVYVCFLKVQQADTFADILVNYELDGRNIGEV
jgi:hypothetical protein